MCSQPYSEIILVIDTIRSRTAHLYQAIEDSPLGLLGHSDADLLAHTVSDALLGAAGLPDIGNLFPASDGAYRNADSMELLRRVVERVRKERWTIVWVDAVIQAQIPRLNAHLPEMRSRLSALLNPGGPNCVNLKAKSAEGTGDPGLGRSMTCIVIFFRGSDC